MSLGIARRMEAREHYNLGLMMGKEIINYGCSLDYCMVIEEEKEVTRIVV